jgi:flagellar biogenesis protein FliO
VWATGQANGDAGVRATGGPWKAVWERAALLWKSVKIRRKTHALRLEETLALGDRRMLAIVEWKGEKLLLGVTTQQITLLEQRENARSKATGLPDEVRQQ